MSEGDTQPHRMRRGKKIVIIAIAVFVALCVACQIFVSLTMNDMFGREDEGEGYRVSYRYADLSEELERTPVSFMSGENTLRGYVYAPENTRGLVVFSHGAGAGHERYINVIKQMCDRGFAVLAFDCTGCGESDGAETRGIEQAAIDLDACLDYVAADETLGSMPLILMGHSQGAYASCAELANGHPEVDAVISISGFDTAMDAIVGQGELMMGGIIHLLYPFFWLDDCAEFGDAAALSAVAGLNATGNDGVPALCIHGTEDEAIAFDSTSLNAQSSRIDDENVRYVAISTEGCNGHNSILSSPAANAERKRVNDEYQRLADEYGGVENVPDSEAARLVNEADRATINESNAELFQAIDDFLADYNL